MSREGVEVVEHGVRAFQRAGIDAWLEEAVAEDAVMVDDPSIAPDPRTWTGHEGWRRALAHMRSMFDDFTIEFHETIDVGDDRVVLVYTQTGTGHQSGARASRRRMAFLHTVADGKIVHSVTFGSVEDALASASGR